MRKAFDRAGELSQRRLGAFTGLRVIFSMISPYAFQEYSKRFSKSQAYFLFFKFWFSKHFSHFSAVAVSRHFSALRRSG
jgi:hypothetical protein